MSRLLINPKLIVPTENTGTCHCCGSLIAFEKWEVKHYRDSWHGSIYKAVFCPVCNGYSKIENIRGRYI